MYSRVLVVGHDEGKVDRITSRLEQDGYIATATMSDSTALDLARSAAFDALVIGAEMPRSERAHIIKQVRNINPYTIAVVVDAPASVLIQLRQAFKEMRVSIDKGN